MKLTRAPWFIFIVVVFATAQLGSAQSGRLKTVPPAQLPSPPPGQVNQTPTQTNTQATAASSAPAQAKASPSPTPTGPRFHPSGFIITGRLITHGGKSYWSDEVKDVANEIKWLWDLERVPAKITKVGKTTRTQAIARAKQETDSYVLYMEIHETIGSTGMRMVSTVDHIDYVLLLPRTGEVARQFQVDPSTIVQTNEHGTPLPPRTQGHSSDYNEQLRRCAWEMARVLRYWL
jgi:hypothetical protein